MTQSSSKSKVAAALLCWFLGGLGIHRFYLGYTGIGIIQLLTCGGLFIWAIIDFILILTGGLKDSEGRDLI
ncbi:TM2 domain-containing protein [Lusitaniella coriacea LEGE 07157]|uniref:TM2 domain-containing protein n=1 Tax=Lusitaniella coriacea LEGE 07157 TaxID=945747 RepID=A0A8J7JF90_9CYAN|nr:TM2 domain-containing protein [Lusitaniella coriacea]MBE9118605.1 TM2 domain-containing protein [Lusitaniella coriacea LEGE 07157]